MAGFYEGVGMKLISKKYTRRQLAEMYGVCVGGVKGVNISE